MIRYILFLFTVYFISSQLSKIDLPTNEQLKVRSIFKDSQGFLWIGSDNGLYRFDGYSVRIFRKNIGPYSISDNFIWDIEEHKEKLYIATESGGLNIYDKRTERFYHFKENSSDGPSHNSINELLLDTLRGGLWLGTYGGALDFFDINEKTFTNYKIPSSLDNNKKSMYIRDLIFDRSNIWLATKDGAIYFDPEKKTYEQKILNGKSIITIKKQNNRLYLGTWGEGLKVFDLTENKLITDENLSKFNKKTPKIWSILFTNSDNALIGSIDEGLYHLSIHDYGFSNINNQRIKSIWNLGQLNSNEVLIASTTGLFKYKKQDEPKLININYTYSILKKNDSILYLGTNKGMRVLNTNTEQLIHNYSNDQGEIYSIYRDKNNNYLFGQKNGLKIINSVTNKEVKTKSTEQIESNVYRVIEDEKNNIIVASGSGLYILDPNYQLKYHFTEQDSTMKISGNIISNVLLDDSNYLWIGTDSKGLNRLKYNSDGRFYCKTVPEFENMVITDLFLDNDSILWVASHGNGLHYKDPITNEFTRVENEELQNLTFYRITQDKKNRFWLSSVNGIYLYNKSDNRYNLLKSKTLGVVFNIDHGILMDQSDKLYINGYDKLLILNTKLYEIRSKNLPFSFTSFRLFNKEVQIAENSILKKSIALTKNLNLNYDQNIFTLSFAALGDFIGDEVFYKHQLEGFNKEWVLSRNHTVTYTNLNPGEYTLKVKAAENPSLFTDEFHELLITVYPPFYLTWYAYLFYISAIFLIYFLRVRSIQKRNRELERLVMQRTIELRELNQNLEKIVENKTKELKETNRSLEGEIVIRKSTEKALEKRSEELKRLFNYVEEVREDERKNLSREVHDELGQILTALKMDTKWIEKKADANAIVLKKSKSMINLIDNAVLAVQRICSALRPNILDELGLIAAIEWQLSDFKERSGINCKLNIKDESNFKLDPDSAIPIFRVFQETLTNVLRHSEATEFEVSILMKENTFVFNMKDNGIGLDENKLSSPKSLGLLGMKERISELGGEISIKGKKEQGTSIDIKLIKN